MCGQISRRAHTEVRERPSRCGHTGNTTGPQHGSFSQHNKLSANLELHVRHSTVQQDKAGPGARPDWLWSALCLSWRRSVPATPPPSSILSLLETTVGLCLYSPTTTPHTPSSTLLNQNNKSFNTSSINDLSMLQFHSSNSLTFGSSGSNN